ncbi:LOW QUALITY PROTEIN: hypothetical protein V1478_014616 [Vespula squamosa]|uniref:Secreted protein n=1 Tax=Vespula squamosa TaxID=30214 RepID=A0ABD2A2Q5_VESSQ
MLYMIYFIFDLNFALAVFCWLRYIKRNTNLLLTLPFSFVLNSDESTSQLSPNDIRTSNNEDLKVISIISFVLLCFKQKNCNRARNNEIKIESFCSNVLIIII